MVALLALVCLALVVCHAAGSSRITPSIHIRDTNTLAVVWYTADTQPTELYVKAS
jgi:hypothetical protein